MGAEQGMPSPGCPGLGDTATFLQTSLQPGLPHVHLLPIEPQTVLGEVAAGGSRGGGLQLPGRWAWGSIPPRMVWGGAQ